MQHWFSKNALCAWVMSASGLVMQICYTDVPNKAHSGDKKKDTDLVLQAYWCLSGDGAGVWFVYAHVHCQKRQGTDVQKASRNSGYCTL